MEEKIFSKQAITDYLFNSLSEEETARFDELSFTNDDFAHALKDIENDLLDAYVNNELDGAALEKFETRYLISPLRREKVEFAKSLKVYAGRNSEKTVFFESPKREGFFASWNFFSNPLLRGAAIAFAVALVALAGFWLINKRLNKPEIDIAVKQENPPPSNIETPKQPEINPAETVKETGNANKKAETSREAEKQTPKTNVAESSRTPKPKENTSAAPVFASFVLAPPLRGANQLPTVSFLKQTAIIKMKLKLEENDFKTYRVALVDESNKTLWRSANLKSRTDGVNVSFSANLLKSGIYSLILSGVSTDGEAEIISNYSFRSVLK